MIEKQFKPSVPLFFKASREVFHSNKSSLALYGLFFGIPTLRLLIHIFNAGGLTYSAFAEFPDWGIFALCFFFPLMFMPAIQYYTVRKSVLSNPSVSQIQYYNVSEEGIKKHGHGVDITLGWKNIVRIKQTKNFLLFYVSYNAALFIPLNLLSKSEIEEIKKWYENRS